MKSANQSKSNLKATNTKTSMKVSKVGVIEDDPNQDPYAFFDILPEPYNFISKWLEELIVKNAFERIIQIEK